MIEITVKELLPALEPLADLGRQKMPVKHAYKVQRLIKKVEQGLEVFNDTRKQVIEASGLDKPLSPTATDDEKTARNALIEKLGKELDELAEATLVKLDVHKLAFTDIEMLNITPLGLLALEPLINAPTEE